jgi:hypothetical protein
MRSRAGRKASGGVSEKGFESPEILYEKNKLVRGARAMAEAAEE